MTSKEAMDDIDAIVNSIENVSVEKSKKKKKNKNKKPGDETNGTAAAPETDLMETEASAEQTQGKKKKKKGKSAVPAGDVAGEDEGTVTKKKGDKKLTTQTNPPSVPISQLFPNGQFPEGQILDHPIAANDATAKTQRRCSMSIES